MSASHVRFDHFQNEALYGETGFYSRGGAAGAVRDFMTAVEASPAFAEAIVVELERRWQVLGQPDPYVIAEGGSGVGSLALACLAARSQCRSALNWVMVEPSTQQRNLAAERLDRAGLLEGDRVSYATDIRQLPEGAGIHVIVANELLDNLAVRVVCKRSEDLFEELFVDPSEPTNESWVELGGNDATRAAHFGSSLEVGAEFPLADRAVAWVWAAQKRMADGGAMMLFDYGADTHELASRPDRGWLRFYRGHQRRTVSDAVSGSVDITSDVPFDQLPGRPHLEPQHEWLIERLPELAEPQDMGSAAIVDPAGMGGFTVATWGAK